MDARAAELSAGVAVADITPPPGFRMSGYFRERISTGTRDPLHAKAIVFAQGKTRAALVICDLVGISLEASSRARKLAAEKTGIPAAHIAVTATHSHTGPLYFGPLRKYWHEHAVAEQGRDLHEEFDYTDRLVEKLVDTIARADAAVQPVKLSAGMTEQTPQISFNRRYHMKDGTVRFNPGSHNPKIVRPAGPMDPDVGILAFRKPEDEKPSAVLTVFAMHADTLGGTEYSADYACSLEKTLKKHFGDSLVCLFGAGTCGDLNDIDVTAESRLGSEKLGTLLGESVVKALPKLKPVHEPSLAVRSERVEVPLQRFTPEQVAAAERDVAKIGTGELPFLREVEAAKIMHLQERGPTAELEVQVFKLSDDTAIVTLPGEIFVEFGLAIKKASPFKTTLVIELANDAIAYVPTKKAFAEGSYETVNSRVKPGGGEMLIETAIRLLKEIVR